MAWAKVAATSSTTRSATASPAAAVAKTAAASIGPSHRAEAGLPQILAAYRDRDSAAFGRLTDRWMAEIGLMDEVLGTDPHFLLGTSQQEAARQAANPKEAAALDYDLKSLVTLWQTESPGLQDYARREFNGLVGGYYAKRWRMFFDALKASLKTGEQPQPIDWRAVAES